MKLFQKREYATVEEKKLSVLRFWFFVLALFSWVIPFIVLYLLNMARTGSYLWSYALKPSLIIFAVVVVILLVVYFVYAWLLKRKAS